MDISVEKIAEALYDAPAESAEIDERRECLAMAYDSLSSFGISEISQTDGVRLRQIFDELYSEFNADRKGSKLVPHYEAVARMLLERYDLDKNSFERLAEFDKNFDSEVIDYFGKDVLVNELFKSKRRGNERLVPK